MTETVRAQRDGAEWTRAGVAIVALALTILIEWARQH